MNNFVFFMCVILVGITGVSLGAAVHNKRELHNILQKDTSGLCLDYLKLDSAKYWNGKYNEIE